MKAFRLRVGGAESYDFVSALRFLLLEFPEIRDVVYTERYDTVVILSDGGASPNVDAWRGALEAAGHEVSILDAVPPSTGSNEAA